jgi:hypothetical protein
MKSKSRQCPNGHGAMKRCHIKITKDKVQSWSAISWQYCAIGHRNAAVLVPLFHSAPAVCCDHVAPLSVERHTSF